jgi:WD40 repeat protein
MGLCGYFSGSRCQKGDLVVDLNFQRLPRILALGLLFMAPAMAAAEDRLTVLAVSFSPDGKLLAAAMGEPRQTGAVVLWDVSTRKAIWQHHEKKGIPTVAFSPDGRTVAIGSYDKDAKLLDRTTALVKKVLVHPKTVRSVAFSPDGRFLATACYDRKIRVWDVGSASVRLTIEGRNSVIFGVVFSPDGKRILSAETNAGAKLWDASTGRERQSIKVDFVPCAEFSPDGNWVIIGSGNGTTEIWNSDTGQMRVRFSGMNARQLAFSEGARTMAVCDPGSRVIGLYDLTFHVPDPKNIDRVRTLLTKLDDDSYEVREGVSEELSKVGFDAEGELRKAMKESASPEVRIRARLARRRLLSKPVAELCGHTGEVYSVAFSPDEKLLASGSKDGTVRIWDVKARHEVAKLATEEGDGR